MEYCEVEIELTFVRHKLGKNFTTKTDEKKFLPPVFAYFRLKSLDQIKAPFLISSTTEGSNSVEISPSLSEVPSAIFRRIRLMNLPRPCLWKARNYLNLVWLCDRSNFLGHHSQDFFSKVSTSSGFLAQIT